MTSLRTLLPASLAVVLAAAAGGIDGSLAAPASPPRLPGSLRPLVPFCFQDDADAQAKAKAMAEQAAATDLLRRAAERQGSTKLVGEKSVDRFRVTFGIVTVHSEKKDRIQAEGSSEAYAGPRFPDKPDSDRIRAEYSVEGKTTVLGHSGRVAWTITGDKKVLRFTDPKKNATDIDDIEHRRRMMRLARRVFFLGGLLEEGVKARAHPAETFALPCYDRKVVTRDIRVLRLDILADGVPLRLYLHEKTLDPAAIRLMPRGEGDGDYLLTMDWYPKDPREGTRGALPEGLRVPNWIELYEMPAKEGDKHLLRLQADVQRLEIDPAALPDSYFLPPRD